ncbi:MAG: Na+/H+ antiporter subunit E [Lysobacterales bacterium]|jgi:multicomponent Na+:H+ antiporter subunit E
MALKTDNEERPSSDAIHWTRSVVLAVLLMLAWVLWSGYLKPLLLGLGIFSSLLVVYLAHRMRLQDNHFLDGRFLLRLPGYWGWLAREVWRSSLEVTRVVLSPKLPISPTVAEFDTRCKLITDQAILGNSITLTPGTLTLQIVDGHFVVHALTEAGARAIVNGEMDRRVAALRGE